MDNNYKKLEKNLNYTIGYSSWKKYIGSAFWSNVSTPINFSITLLTAFNTGQAASGYFMSNDLFIKLNIITLFISTVNTFFKPNEQYNSNNEYLKKWNEFGSKFENIYFTVLDDEEKYLAYLELQQEINNFENSISPNSQSFITDLIHFIANKTCLKRKEQWLDFNNEYFADIELATIYMKKKQSVASRDETKSQMI